MSSPPTRSARRVLDTSALMSGRSFEGELFITEEVLRELRKQGALTPQLEAFLAVKVRVVSPSRQAEKSIEEASHGTGDAHRLSPTDVGLLALASELGAAIVTDDYSIQNLAAEIGVPYEPVQEEGIREVVRWRYRCAGCGKSFAEWHDPCPVCGAKLHTSRARRNRESNSGQHPSR